MIQNIKEYIAPYVALDNPVVYKNINIYPIKVKDYSLFDNIKNILLVEKNKIADIEIIQMTYLDYIVKKLIGDETIFQENLTMGAMWYVMLIQLLSLCLHINEDNIDFIEDEHSHIKLKINDTIINSDDFDDIKKIILYQNLINYDDTPMSDDVKEAIVEYYRIVNKGIIPLTLEDMIDVVIVDTHYTIEYIHELTYRRFTRLFERICDKLDYVVGYYGYTREKPPEHYIYRKEKNKYADVFTDVDTFEKKFNSV